MDLQSLGWKQFEDLCVDYLRCHIKANCGTDIPVVHRPYSNDGGYDIELQPHHLLEHEPKFRAECKSYRRAIDLDTLGKCVVMVIVDNINLIYFFSASRIRERTKEAIKKVEKRSNFRAVFLDDANFKNTLLQHPEVIEKYFPGYHPPAVDAKSSLIEYVIVSEFKDSFCDYGTAETKKFTLRNDNIFFLRISLKNTIRRSGMRVRLTLERFNDNPDVEFLPAQPRSLAIPYLHDELIEYDCIVRNFKNDVVPLPDILIEFDADGEDGDCMRLELPDIDLRHLKRKRIPFSGKANHEFISGAFAQCVENVREGYPHLLNISGCSGTGKSRLIAEMDNRLRLLGFSSHYYDCALRSDMSALRNLVADLMDLPFHGNKFKYGRNDIFRIVEMESGHADFSGCIADFLMRRRINENFHFIVESLAYFMERAAKKAPVSIVFDNAQRLDRQSMEVLKTFSDIMSEKSIPFMFAFSFTTDDPLLAGNGTDASLEMAEYLNALGKSRKTKIRVLDFECGKLTENDIEILVDNLFDFSYAGVEAKTGLIRLISRERDSRALDVIANIEYLQQIGCIAMEQSLFRVADTDKLRDISCSGPRSAESGAGLRLRMLAQRISTAGERKEIKRLFAALLLFENLLDEDFAGVNSTSEEIRDHLFDTFILRRSDDNKITFYHDDIYRMAATDPKYAIDKKTAFCAVAWLDDRRSRWDANDHMAYFKAKSLIALREEVLRSAEEALEAFAESDNASGIVRVCDRLLAFGWIAENPRYYFRFAELQARTVFGKISKNFGRKLYLNLHRAIREKPHAYSGEKLPEFLHALVNANLQNTDHSKALEVLAEFSKLDNLSPFHRFIIKNRFGVSHSNMGDFKRADAAYKESIAIALSEKNRFLLSTTYSDVALNKLYDPGTGSIRSALHYLRKAIRLHGKCGETPSYRSREMEWHAVLEAILSDNLSDAEKIAAAALDDAVSRRDLHQASRLYYLYGLILQKTSRASDCIALHGKGIAFFELNSFKTALIRMYNNMAVAEACLAGDLRAAAASLEKSLSLVSALEISDVNSRDNYVKHVPIFANRILVAHRSGDRETRDRIIKEKAHIDSRFFKRFCKQLRVGGEIQPLTSFMFDGFAFVF